MTFSPLISRIVPCSMYSSRNGVAVDHLLYHHQAGTNSEAVARAMQDGTRQVSANYIITNEGEIWGVIPEEFRAWTSGSSSDGGKGAAWDRRSITFEVENETTAPGWTISFAAQQALAELSHDISQRYGFALTRQGSASSVLEHRELWEYFRASYPTECPGGLPTGSVVAAANSGGAGLENGAAMRFFQNPADAGTTAKPVWYINFPAGPTRIVFPSPELANQTAVLLAQGVRGIYPSDFGLANTAAGWETVKGWLTPPAGGSGGATVAQIAAAVDAAIDDEAIVTALQALDVQSDSYQADLKATLAKGLSGTITLK